MSLLRRLVLLACWSSVAVAYVAAILPQDEAPHLGASDKVDHMAAFFTICFLARLAYWRTSAAWILTLAAAFGVFIELSQLLPVIHRDAEFADWAADIVASIIGLLAAWPLLGWWRRREREQA